MEVFAVVIFMWRCHCRQNLIGPEPAYTTARCSHQYYYYSVYLEEKSVYFKCAFFQDNNCVLSLLGKLKLKDMDCMPHVMILREQQNNWILGCEVSFFLEI